MPGEAPVLALAVRRNGDLITPHGDRKRLFERRRWAASGRSLPLMGIGNDETASFWRSR